MKSIDERITDFVNKAIAAVLENEYSYCYRKGTYKDQYVIEIEADYRDRIENNIIAEILETEDPYGNFVEKVCNMYSDEEYRIEESIKEATQKVLNEDAEFKALLKEDEEALEELMYADFYDYKIRDCIYEFEERGIICITYPFTTLENQDVACDLFIDTGDSNYDFTLNTEFDKDGKLPEKASLVWLAKQQGYTKEELEKAIAGDEALLEKSKFLRSVKEEVENSPSELNALTFLVNIKLGNLMRITKACLAVRNAYGIPIQDSDNSDFLGIGKETMAGLFNWWSGAGSLLEIELERDVEIPLKHIFSFMPDGCMGQYGDIQNVYGMCGSAWKDTFKYTCIAARKENHHAGDNR